jgi:dienelactone hydrolase
MWYARHMRIEAVPADAMYDQPVSIRLADFPPGREVSIRAFATDGLGQRWQSAATFMTDSRGAADLALQAPQRGSYAVADPMGLLWSMALDSAVVERTPFVKPDTSPVEVALAAELDGSPAATARLTRRYAKPGLVQTPVRDDGLVAEFFHHEGERRPGLIMVGGSNGGLAIDGPALLASHGYAVLSLGYFAMPGLPAALIEVPLEYFGRAIAWMRRSPQVAPGGLGIMGISRGGELVLLLGSIFQEVTAVVAYVPSGVLWPGIGGDPQQRSQSAWTLGGKPLPCVEPTPQDPAIWSKLPAALTPWFRECLKNQSSVEQAAIAVEKINGPVLMFSGTDDQMWPSLNLADLAVRRLLAHDFSHHFEHISYAGAGHFIRFPYSPVLSDVFHPVARASMALGGTPEANHVAGRESWRRTLSFLETYLAARRG